MTPFEVAYAVHAPGSPAFLAAVDFAGRYQVSDTKARRIASSPTAPRYGNAPGETKRGGKTARTPGDGHNRLEGQKPRRDRQAPRALENGGPG